jgi:hypothetical protein
MLIGIATLNLSLIGAIAWWISSNIAPTDKPVFWSALIARLCGGIALGLVYHYYYGLGDTLGYFQDALRLNDLAGQDVSLYFNSLFTGTPPIELVNREPRAFFFTALVSVVNFLSGRNYWITSLWFSLFSFACAWYFVVRVSTLLPGIRRAAVMAFLFFPSVVFWSSGIVKESIGFGALCILAGIFCRLMNSRRPLWYEYPAMLIALWLLLSLKYYWAAVFFPAALSTLLVHWFIATRVSKTSVLVVCWLGAFMILCVMASFTHPNFYLEEFLTVIRQNHDEFLAISAPGNVIHFPVQVNEWTDIAVNAPWALFSGLFRPLPHEVTSLSGIVSSIENLALLAMAVFSLRRVQTPHVLLLLAVMFYTILLCVFLAMSTPNFGTLSRYRIGFLPFFVMVVLHGNPLIKKIGLILKPNSN